MRHKAISLDLFDHGMCGTDSISKCPNRQFETRWGHGLKEDIDGFDDKDSTSLYIHIMDICMSVQWLLKDMHSLKDPRRYFQACNKIAICSIKILQGHYIESFDFDWMSTFIKNIHATNICLIYDDFTITRLMIEKCLTYYLVNWYSGLEKKLHISKYHNPMLLNFSPFCNGSVSASRLFAISDASISQAV